jgi:cytochrome c
MSIRRSTSALGAAVLLMVVIVGARATARTASVRRGQYLVNAIGCNDCHTPMRMSPTGPTPDPSRILSGHPEGVVPAGAPAFADQMWTWAGDATNTAFAGPWGISFATNLTPDRNTGLGIWTEAMFVRAIRTGRHMGQSRPIAPPMPWQSFRNLDDADLRAVFAYLRTIPPVTNHVPDYVPQPKAVRN